nr:MAG TPA: hypothetical protein [Caudoviricetes sp.]
MVRLVLIVRAIFIAAMAKPKSPHRLKMQLMFFFCIKELIRQMVGHIIHLLLLGLNLRLLLRRMVAPRSKQILHYLSLRPHKLKIV